MSINPTTQLVLLLYEYLYNKGNRIEQDYLDMLDRHYATMFSHQPDRYVRSSELLELLEQKARFDHFVEIQSEIYDLLSLYKPGSVNNPDK